MTLRTIIIDDILSSVQTLVEFSKDIKELEIIGTASNVDDAIQLINEQNPDLLLLDIQIGNRSGFEILEACSDKYQQVIFITAYDNYALKSYQYPSVHYLLKPITMEDLQSAVLKATSMSAPKSAIHEQIQELRNIIGPKHNQNKLFLPSKNIWKSIEISSIQCIEAKASYCMVYTDSIELMVSKSLKYFEDVLMDQPDFIRVQKSYIVNQNMIREVYRGLKPKLILHSGIEVPISLQLKDKVFTILGIKNTD